MSRNEINERLKKLFEISDKDYQKIVMNYEREIVKEYKIVLDNILKKIRSIYEKYGEDLDYADAVSYNRLKNLESQIKEQIKSLTIKNISTLKTKLGSFLSESFNLTAYSIDKATQLNLAFGLIDPLTIEAAWKNPLSKIKWPESMKLHAQKYLSDIQSEITRGLIEGKGYFKIAAGITEKTSINANKVLRIVRTEAHRVQNTAKIIAFENTEAAADRLGLKTNRVWVATLDNKTRDSHQSMDGQIADENNLFHYPSGETTEAPGISGPAEEVINCRCTIITQFADFPQQFRKDNISKNIIPFQSYAEWKTKNLKTL